MKTIFQDKNFLGLIGNVLVVLLFGWVSYQRFENYKYISKLKIDKDNLILHTEKIKAISNGLANDSKGYIITGNERYLTTFNKTVFSIGRELEYLAGLSLNNDQLKKKVVDLETSLDEKIGYYNHLIEIRKQEGKENKGIVLVNEEINSTNKIIQLITDLLSQADIIFQTEIRKKESLAKKFNIAFNVLFSFSIFLLIIVYLIIRHYLKQRNETASSLEENQQLLQSILDNTSNPIFIKQINGEYLLVNKQFEYLFHYSNEKIKGKTDHEIFSKEVAEDFRTGDLDVIKAEKEIKREEKISHNDELHTYLMVRFPIRDNKGKIYAVGGIATEITEMKKLDMQVRHSQKQVLAMFNSAPEPIIGIDEEGNVIKWNKKAEALFGWKEEEVQGKPMHEIIMPVRFRELHLNGLKHFIKTGEGPILNKTVELSAINRKNEEFDIELTVSSFKQEGKYFFIAFLRDITKRKFLEKKVNESQTFLDSIVDNIPDIIFVKDVNELRYVRLNTAGELFMGVSRSGLLGKNNYDLFPKEQADFFAASDNEAIRLGGIIDIPEESANTKKGKRWLHTKKICIKDEKGNPIYLLGISEDITEKKQLEDEKELAEKLMRQNEQRMTLILENIGEGVIVSDVNGKILLSNHIAEEILNIDETQGSFDWSEKYTIYYRNGQTIFPAQNLPLQRALRNEPTDDMELILFDPKLNETKRIVVTGRPIRDENNNVIAGVATIKDITKYIELETALRESEKKYRNLIGFKMKGPDKGPVDSSEKEQ